MQVRTYCQVTTTPEKSGKEQKTRLSLDPFSQRLLEHLFTHALAFQAFYQCCYRVLLQTLQICPEPLPTYARIKG